MELTIKKKTAISSLNRTLMTCLLRASPHLQALTNLLNHQNPAIFVSPKALLQLQAQLITTGLSSSNSSQWPLIVRTLGFDAEPLKLFSFFRAIERLRSLSHWVFDPFLYASLVKGCAKLRALREGRSVHCRVVMFGLDRNVNVKNSLIGLYASTGFSMRYAHVLFDEMRERTVVSVNSLVSGLIKNGSLDDGLGLVKRALTGFCGPGLKPNHVTLVVLVSGCVDFGRFSLGKSLHCYSLKSGFGSVIELCNALVEFYSKFDRTNEALLMFEGMVKRDLVSWNTMISNHASTGSSAKAFSLFSEMRETNLGFDRVSLVSLILAAGHEKCTHLVKMVHGYVTKVCGIEISLPIGTALINMYSKCRSIEYAEKIFFQVKSENISHWNSMIHSYVECGRYNEALALFDQIKSKSLKPDEVTMLGLITACRNSRKLIHGIEINSRIESCSYLNQSVVLHNALIDMYSKCGDVERAKNVFDKMPERDVFSWSSMISGLAMNGRGNEAVIAFERMKIEGVEPNSVTFLGVLFGCDHSGLVDEGLDLYNEMCNVYKIRPGIEHCGCVVDMLARSGRVQEAIGFVKRMPIEPNGVIWRMLVNGCRFHGDYDTGMNLIGQAVNMEMPRGAEDCVVSSNFFAEIGKWEEVLNERTLLVNRRVAGVSSGFH